MRAIALVLCWIASSVALAQPPTDAAARVPDLPAHRVPCIQVIGYSWLHGDPAANLRSQVALADAIDAELLAMGIRQKPRRIAWMPQGTVEDLYGVNAWTAMHPAGMAAIGSQKPRIDILYTGWWPRPDRDCTQLWTSPPMAVSRAYTEREFCLRPQYETWVRHCGVSVVAGDTATDDPAGLNRMQWRRPEVQWWAEPYPVIAGANDPGSQVGRIFHLDPERIADETWVAYTSFSHLFDRHMLWKVNPAKVTAHMLIADPVKPGEVEHYIRSGFIWGGCYPQWLPAEGRLMTVRECAAQLAMNWTMAASLPPPPGGAGTDPAADEAPPAGAEAALLVPRNGVDYRHRYRKFAK